MAETIDIFARPSDTLDGTYTSATNITHLPAEFEFCQGQFGAHGVQRNIIQWLTGAAVINWSKSIIAGPWGTDGEVEYIETAFRPSGGSPPAVGLLAEPTYPSTEARWLLGMLPASGGVQVHKYDGPGWTNLVLVGTYAYGVDHEISVVGHGDLAFRVNEGASPFLGSDSIQLFCEANTSTTKWADPYGANFRDTGRLAGNAHSNDRILYRPDQRYGYPEADYTKQVAIQFRMSTSTASPTITVRAGDPEYTATTTTADLLSSSLVTLRCANTSTTTPNQATNTLDYFQLVQDGQHVRGMTAGGLGPDSDAGVDPRTRFGSTGFYIGLIDTYCTPDEHPYPFLLAGSASADLTSEGFGAPNYADTPFWDGGALNRAMFVDENGVFLSLDMNTAGRAIADDYFALTGFGSFTPIGGTSAAEMGFANRAAFADAGAPLLTPVELFRRASGLTTANLDDGRVYGQLRGVYFQPGWDVSLANHQLSFFGPYDYSAEGDITVTDLFNQMDTSGNSYSLSWGWQRVVWGDPDPNYANNPQLWSPGLMCMRTNR